MRHRFLVALMVLIAGPALACPGILPISRTDYLVYDVATGAVRPATAGERYGHPLWAATEMTGYFLGVSPPEGVLDWGDIAGPAAVGGFSFAQYTNSQAADGHLSALIAIYTEENGWNSTGRVYVIGYVIDNIPGSTHPPNEYSGHIWGVDVYTPLALDGNDLDGDGLVDWGYFQFFSVTTPGAVHGPAIATFDPNMAPGADEWYDLFRDGNYVETCSLGPFHQLYWAMFAPSCPNRGDSGRYCSADIDGSFDCIVSLADLAVLLAHYGMTAGATPLMGDVDPYDAYFPGDGDVDLADLAELLMQYGDDCDWP